MGGGGGGEVKPLTQALVETVEAWWAEVPSPPPQIFRYWSHIVNFSV